MRQDDRAAFDRGLHRARESAYLPGEFVGQESFMTARETRALAAQAGIGPGVTVLDLCCGAGGPGCFLTRELGCEYLGVDASATAVAIARERAGGLACRFATARVPPLPAGSFDVVTAGYGLRNVPDLTAAIDEMYRVLKHGGQALSLDFDRPEHGTVRAVYLWYLSLVGGVLGWVLHRDPDTYRYIPASIRLYPGAEAVAELMKVRGFTSVRHYRVLGGLMAIHHATK